MKTIPTAFLNHIRSEKITTAVCFRIDRKDGVIIRGTDHDTDIIISSGAFAGLYYSITAIDATDSSVNSNMAVDNIEVETQDAPDYGVTIDDIQAGRLDGAAVTVFVVNWQSPGTHQEIIKKGFLGAVTIDSDSGIKCEVRGLASVLAQNIGRVISDQCDARLGDSRCGFNVAPITAYCQIAAITSQREFELDIISGATSWAYLPTNGGVLFTSGANDGVEREIRLVTVSSGNLLITTYDELPETLTVGDLVTFTPGCDRNYSTCKYYGNLANFRGHGVFLPGLDALVKGGASGGEWALNLPPDVP